MNDIVTLADHPLLMRSFKLMRKVDTLPAHPDQTVLISNLGAWRDQLTAYLKKHDLLRKDGGVPKGLIKVVKVRFDEGGPELILTEDEKDQFWDYCEDWLGKVEIKFTTMDAEAVAALPEFSP